jgi:hypothetical protein
MYDVLERGARRIGCSSAALLPEDAGREGVGVAWGVSGAAFIAYCCGAVASGGSAVELPAGGRAGLWQRRTEPIMERGICTRKEPLAVREEGDCIGSLPCLWAASAVNNMSSIVPAAIVARDSTCWVRNQHTDKARGRTRKRWSRSKHRGSHDPFDDL